MYGLIVKRIVKISHKSFIDNKRAMGIEPTSGNLQPTFNKELTENTNSGLCASLCKPLQKHPDLEQIISAWPDLPEHIKAAIKTLIQTHITEIE